MKKAVTLLLAAIMIFAATAAMAADITVLVNGEKVEFDRQPELQNGKVMIPFRFVAEKLGATVAWEEETQTIFTSLNGSFATMQIGNQSIFVDGKTYVSEKAPFLVVDRTLVSEEALEQSLGADVTWDEAAQTVTIIK